MNKHNKFLLGIFLLLLLVTIGEVIYYFSVLSPQKSLEQVSFSQNQNQSTQPQSGFVPPINNNAIRYVNGIDRRLLQSSTLMNVYKGTIADIEKRNGTFVDRGYGISYTYSHILTINSPANDATVPFYFADSDMKKMTIETSSNESISFDDLKAGDTILIEEKMDTLTDDYKNVFTFRIIKQ